MSVSESVLADKETPKGSIPKRCVESPFLTKMDLEILHQKGYSECVVCDSPDRGIRLAKDGGFCKFAKMVDGAPTCELRAFGDYREPAGCMTADPEFELLERDAACRWDVPDKLWYEMPSD